MLLRKRTNVRKLENGNGSYFLFLTIFSTFNFLPNDKNLNKSKLKAFAEDKINVTEICIGKNGNIVGKRRKCWLPAFSRFPTTFSKGFLYSVVLSRDNVAKSSGENYHLKMNIGIWMSRKFCDIGKGQVIRVPRYVRNRG